MRRSRVIGLILCALIAVTLLSLLLPGPRPESIALSIQQIKSPLEKSPVLAVLVSNSSPNIIVYPSSVLVLCWESGVLRTNYLDRGFGIGSMTTILRPGQADKQFLLGESVTTNCMPIRVGVEYTALSW